MIKTDNKLSAYYMQGTVLDAESELVTAFPVKLIRVVPACWICKFGQNSIHFDPCTKSLQLKWLVRGNGKYSKTFQFFPLELSSIWTEHLMPSLADSGFQKVGKTHHHPLVLTTFSAQMELIINTIKEKLFSGCCRESGNTRNSFLQVRVSF